MRRFLPILVVIVLLIGAWAMRDRLSQMGTSLFSSIREREITSPEMIATVTPLSVIETTQDAQKREEVEAKQTQEAAAAENLAAQSASQPVADPPTPGPPTPTPFIPPTPQPAQYHQVQTGDTLAAIARKYGVAIDTLVAENKLVSSDVLVVGRTLYIPPPPTPSQPPPNTEVYIVQAGDTLAAITRRVGIGLEDLKKLNPHLRSPDHLAVGDLLFIPIQPTATPRPTATPVPQERVALPPTEPPPPPQPTATPLLRTAAGDCPAERQESRVWGVSFCRPAGWWWQMEEWDDPAQPATLIYVEDDLGVRSLYAIFRSEGAAKKPLSAVLKDAQALVPGQLARAIPAGITLEGEWQRIADHTSAGQADQRAEIAARYTLDNTPARVRLIVFNHENENRRWQLLMAAPELVWTEDMGPIFDHLSESIEVFAP